MKAFLERLEQAADLREVQSLVDHILDAARAGGKPEDKRRFLRDLLFNRGAFVPPRDPRGHRRTPRGNHASRVE